MLRFLAGVASALLLVAAGVILWRNSAGAAETQGQLPPPPIAGREGEKVPLFDVDTTLPKAGALVREQRRFARFDKDRDGHVTREEYLASRRKAYAKLDANHDGRLDFEEWASKTTTKFAAADADKSGALDRVEFRTTAVVRHPRVAPPCPPADARDDG